MYVCTATAGEECQDTELFSDEKPHLRQKLFQFVKVHKSQHLSVSQNQQFNFLASIENTLWAAKRFANGRRQLDNCRLYRFGQPV